MRLRHIDRHFDRTLVADFSISIVNLNYKAAIALIEITDQWWEQKRRETLYDSPRTSHCPATDLPRQF